MRRRAFIGQSFAASLGCLIVPRTLLAQSQPIVETSQGRVRGITNQAGIHVFKGLRYGASTAGSRRFLPPLTPQNWSGVQDAFDYGDRCPQAGSRMGETATMSDDCLRINIWSPGLDDTRRPVMLWFHGGGFESGSGQSPRYEGTNLARRGDVVVATINHRLNVYGHCYLGGILGEEFAQSGNAGYLDLIASMKWVKENIAAFGGDPNNITIFGQSGGGRKVSLCYAGDDAQGLYQRGIIQSGSHLLVKRQEEAHQLTEILLQELGIDRNNARRLQNVDINTLSTAQRKVARENGTRFSPMLDGVTFSAQPWLPNAPDASRTVPMMLGTTRTELTNQLGGEAGIFDMDESQAKERLTRFLNAEDIDVAWEIFQNSRPQANPSEVFFTIASARGYRLDQTLMAEQRVKQIGAGNTYVYRLMWRQPVEGGRRVSQHSLCIPFVFDNVGVVPDVTGPETDSTRAMADSMANTWIAFARSGDPNNSSIPEWSPYDLQNRNTMLFDDPSRAVNDPHQAEREFLAAYETQQIGGLSLHRR